MMWNFKLKVAVAIASATLLAVSAWKTYDAGYQAGASRLQAKWDAEVALMAKAQAEELQKAWTKTADLQAQIDQQRRTHRNEIARINRNHAALVDSLRDRPEVRAGDGGVPEGAAAGVGCTGAGLSRADSEFLVWIGREAARTQAALNACIIAYDEVRRTVNGD